MKKKMVIASDSESDSEADSEPIPSSGVIHLEESDSSDSESSQETTKRRLDHEDDRVVKKIRRSEVSEITIKAIQELKYGHLDPNVDFEYLPRKSYKGLKWKQRSKETNSKSNDSYPSQSSKTDLPSSPTLKFQTMWAYCDKKLQCLPDEDVDDIELKILTLIYEKTKAHRIRLQIGNLQSPPMDVNDEVSSNVGIPRL